MGVWLESPVTSKCGCVCDTFRNAIIMADGKQVIIRSHRWPIYATLNQLLRWHIITEFLRAPIWTREPNRALHSSKSRRSLSNRSEA
jgi:hypothetical protein